MSLDPDALLERRRLKRRLAGWRAAAILALLAALLVAADELAGSGGGWFGGGHVARVVIEGVITDDRDRAEALDDLVEDGSVRAVIIEIDSPGGTTYGGERLYASLRRLAQAKPTVAVIGTVGASGGYMAALAADRIFAGESSITGSIGVLFQAAEFSRLLDRLGVSAEAITSGPLKAEPSPFKPMSEAARAATRQLVDDTHAWFVGLVAERRRLDPERARVVADGRVFIGRTAVKEGLVDELGSLREARAWLEREKGVSADLPLYDVEWSEEGDGWRSLVTGWFGKGIFAERLTLDGLVSLWHAPLALEGVARGRESQ